MASLALRAFLRTPKREPKTAPLALVKPETDSWDAVAERLNASWEPLAGRKVHNGSNGNVRRGAAA